MERFIFLTFYLAIIYLYLDTLCGTTSTNTTTPSKTTATDSRTSSSTTITTKVKGTLFAVPGDDVFFNISFTKDPLPNNFIAVQKNTDDGNKVMVFLDSLNPPEIAGAYRGRINYTGNIERAEMTFWLYNVSIVDAGEFRVVPIGIRTVLGSQILAVAGRPDNPTIAERTIPQVNKDYVLECKTHSNSRPETNGFQTSFIWKRNDTVLGNNLIYTVQGQILCICHLQREDRFDRFTCVAYDSPKLPSNASNYYQIDPKYGPSYELTLDPSNRTYFVEEGFEMRNITCSADCHPDCIFTWDRGITQGAKLYLGVIDVDKDGIYRCTAQNPITNVSFTTSLEVVLTTERERNEFPVTMVSSVSVAAFATINIAIFSCMLQILQN